MPQCATRAMPRILCSNPICNPYGRSYCCWLLQLKAVDPPTFPDLHHGFPHSVKGARLAIKMEDDVHCDYQRVSYSAVFQRARGLRPSRISSLRGRPGLLPAGGLAAACDRHVGGGGARRAVVGLAADLLLLES